MNNLLVSICNDVNLSFCSYLMYFSDKYVLYVQPHLDFGLNLLGGDVMAIPGVYQYVQVLCLLGFKSAICFKVLYDDLLYYG